MLKLLIVWLNIMTHFLRTILTRLWQTFIEVKINHRYSLLFWRAGLVILEISPIWLTERRKRVSDSLLWWSLMLIWWIKSRIISIMVTQIPSLPKELSSDWRTDKFSNNLLILVSVQSPSSVNLTATWYQPSTRCNQMMRRVWNPRMKSVPQKLCWWRT